MFSVEFRRKADKFLDKVDLQLAARLVKAAEDLSAKPFPHDVVRVENEWFEGEKVFRIRVGDYRILYTVSYEKKRILIVNVDKRPRAYQ